MQTLQTIEYNDDRITLSARELHEFLEVSTRYNDWFKRMSEYGFEENVDYQAITQKRVTAQGNENTYTNHQITIEMAKEIAMLQRNEKGKQARQYFIKLEKEWNSPEKVMARALRMANKEIDNLRIEVDSMKPKAIFADAVCTSEDSILIGQLAKLIRQNGHEIGQNRLFEWLRIRGYLMNRGADYNLPTQKSMELGLMEIKERTVTNPDGSVRITKTTKITGKGQIYFVNKFCSKGDQK